MLYILVAYRIACRQYTIGKGNGSRFLLPFPNCMTYKQAVCVKVAVGKTGGPLAVPVFLDTSA